MPHTLAALERGIISEWRATLLVRETACLSAEHRREIDAQLAGDPAALEGLGDRRLVAEIQKLACRLDPASVARRRAHAEADRRVTCRPAPDTMAILSGVVPVAQGVAMYAALRRETDSRVAAGDPRTRGQIMADTLVERVTGQASAGAVPVEIQLVMSDGALLGDGTGPGSDDPGVVHGFGAIPADLARRLVVSAAEAEAAWLRRLYVAPESGSLVAMESQRRSFPAGLARFIRVRDQFCRTPWCEAPIRHSDHVVPHHDHGPTSADNGQGLCAQCNLGRQAPGWVARTRKGTRHTVEITTPTGHRYISIAPRPPGSSPRSRKPAASRPRRGRRFGLRRRSPP
ncbi:HNH endonuclease [Pseudonocardia nigra]|uniref:HNH endonuclease n=1 Tax=Pseudonocardia nigra TaxID=1921578 RepID=UPI001C5EFEF9